ncbi:hypothetical protein [Mycolicibacterium sp.]|uniref:hypothetical protein n=1 Tax=Mycolicibacterium sp. TaxID=2320850 RepID=UPI0037C9F824
MASTKYVGYVGGVAVAVGVGAAIAAASQGTANAETDSGSTAKESSATSSPAGTGVKAGPKKRSAGESGSDRPKPLSKVNDGVEKAVSQVTKTASTVSKSITDSLTTPATKPTTKPTTKPAAKPKPTADEFEAKQVQRLKDLFNPKEAAAPKPTPKPDSALENSSAGKTVTTTPTVRTAVQDQADTTADAPAWDPNPFRADDPEPTDFPEPIMQLRQALLNASPDALDPFVREGTEQIYRGTQMVPWVNAVIPISRILPSLAPAVEGDLDARQTIINELIKTTPPGSFAYYGYDLVADLINMEGPAADLKDLAVGTVWDVLDPFELAHHKGTSGIGQAV